MRKEKGQSLIEVLIVLAITAIMVGALIIVILTGLKNSQYAQNQNKATKYAQETIERIRTLRDRNNIITLYNGSDFSSATFDNFLKDSNKCADKANACYFHLDQDLQFYEITSTLADPYQYILPDENFSEQIKVWKEGNNEKTFSVRISWKDASGFHESNLQTILVPRVL